MKTVTRRLRQRLQTKLGINSGIVRKKNNFIFSSASNSDIHETQSVGSQALLVLVFIELLVFLSSKYYFILRKKKTIKRKKALFKTFKGDGQIWIRSRKISSLISFLLYWVKSRVNSLKSVIMIMKATQSVFQFNWILQQPMNKHS